MGNTPLASAEEYQTELEIRAARGDLTFGDQRCLQHAKAARDGLAAGKTIAAIAAELGDISRSSLTRFIGSAKFKGALRVIESGGLATRADVDEETALETARRTLAGTLPDALDFLIYCFKRDEEKPSRPYKDEGLAQWATERLLKSTGLTDPKVNGGAAPAIVVTAEAMQVMLGAIRGDDSVREKDVTPQPPPAARSTIETTAAPA